MCGASFRYTGEACHDPTPAGSFNPLGWIEHTAYPFFKNHWRESLEIVGGGLCIFASAGVCLVAGAIYTGANLIADVYDTHSLFSRRTLTDLAENGGTMLVFGYTGKVIGGFLASTGAKDVNDAFYIAKDLWKMPYLKTDIGKNALVRFDYISTAHLLINNAIWTTVQCYSSLSRPCNG